MSYSWSLQSLCVDSVINSQHTCNDSDILPTSFVYCSSLFDFLYTNIITVTAVVMLTISTTATTTPPMIAAVLSASEQFTVSVETTMEWLSVLPVVYGIF